MAVADTLSLLVVGGTPDEVTNLQTLLRATGYALQVEHIDQTEEISLALGRGNWQLALALPIAGDLPVAAVGEGLGTAVPWIAQVPASDAELALAALQAGATAWVDPSRTGELLLTVQRALQVPARADNAVVEEAVEADAFFSDGMILQANDAFAEYLGYASAEDLDCLPVIDLIATQDQDKFKAFLKNLGTRPSELAISVVCANGEERFVPMVLSTATHEGEICRRMLLQPQDTAGGSGGSFSMNDPATGLINRQFFLDHLAAAILQAANVTTIDHVLLVSIDQFDALTNQYGFSGADAIVSDLAALLRPHTGKANYLSRFADGSLAFMLPDSDAETALALAGTLCQQVADHICDMRSQTVQYTLSIGVTALNAKSPRDPVELMDQCRQALQDLRQQAGNNGIGNGVQLFSRSQKAAVTQTEPHKLDLEEALDQNRLRLVFQPLLSIRGDSGDHYEALLRMLDENDELLPPVKFLDQLTPKLAPKLDRWVILEGVKHLSQQRAKGKDTRLIVNLTPHALEDDALAGWLKVALQAADVPANAVVFQMAESDFARNINQGREFAERLRTFGSGLSIAHFGEGVNDPATVLKHLPVDYVKLDPKFTRDLQDGSGDPQPLKDLVALVTGMDKKAVVPHVENASVLAILWQAGANFIQGNYLQPPQPAMNYEFSDIA